MGKRLRQVKSNPPQVENDPLFLLPVLTIFDPPILTSIDPGGLVRVTG